MADTGEKVRARLEAVPFGAPAAEMKRIFDRDGAVILEGVLSPEQVAQVNADLEPAMQARRAGTDKEDEFLRDFFGSRTKRVTNVVTLSPLLQEALFANPVTMDYVRAVYAGVSDTFWLNTCQVIEILPGEKAQVLHRDLGNYPIFYQYGPTGPEVMVNMIVALMDVTDEAGATRVIPGSHLWEFDQEGSPEMTIPAELKAGSAVFYSGKLVHGGGANRTRDVNRRVIAVPYNPGFLVPEEAYPFIVPLEEVKKMSPQMQQLIGFRSFHQREPRGGSLWQHNYEEIADHLGL